VIFEGPDGSLGRVDPVVVGFDELEVGASLSDASFDGLGGFIIEDIKFGFEAVVGQDAIQVLVGAESFGIAAVFHGFNQNSVAVIIIEDQHILVALLGRDRKGAREIGIDNPIVDVGQADGGKGAVRRGWLLQREEVGGVGFFGTGRRVCGLFGLGRSSVFWGLVKVALGSRNGLGKVLGDGV
jgi:hypothetical protein